jgi:hypothetical protein
MAPSSLPSYRIQAETGRTNRVERVALRAERRDENPIAKISVRSARPGLSRRDKHHLRENQMLPLTASAVGPRVPSGLFNAQVSFW